MGEFYYVEVRGKIVDAGVHSLEGALNQNKINWLSHVLRISTTPVSLCAVSRGG